jgi:hypothetical protein
MLVLIRSTAELYSIKTARGSAAVHLDRDADRCTVTIEQ